MTKAAVFLGGPDWVILGLDTQITFNVVMGIIEDIDEHIHSIQPNTDIIKQAEILSSSVYEQKIYGRFNKISE